MGIFGFGNLRDKFTTPGTVEAGKYVACLDVTSAMVYAIRNSRDEEQFRELFTRRMWTSKELRYLRHCPPSLLCYTLDNRSPLAKKQTQLQRTIDSRTLLMRTAAAINVAYATDKDAQQQSQGSLRVCQVVKVIREVLTSERFRVACDGVEFDYGEGEGEIKGFRWLCRQQQCDTKLLMSRDNDVFVYVLSVMQYLRDDSRETFLIFHANSDSVLACWNHIVPQYRDKCWVLLLWLSVCFGNDYTYGVLHKSVANIDYYFALLQRAFVRYQTCAYRPDLFSLIASSTRPLDTTGRDGVPRLFDEDAERSAPDKGSHNDHQLVSANCENACRAQHSNDNSNAKQRDRLLRRQNVATTPQSIADLLKDQFPPLPPSSATSRPKPTREHTTIADSNERSVVSAAAAAENVDKLQNSVDLLTNAIVCLQHVLRGNNAVENGEALTLSPGANNQWCQVWRQHGRVQRSELQSCDTDDDRDDDDGDETPPPSVREMHDRSERRDEWIRVRGWFSRQLWSFFYIMELPNSFVRNEHFALCPSIRINTAFDKPYLSFDSFMRLRRSDIQRVMSSVLIYGI